MATIDKHFQIQKNVGSSSEFNKSKTKTHDVSRVSATTSSSGITAVTQHVAVLDEEIIGETADLNLLRQFDLDSKYGPCTGITRLERWNRAARFNFDPPIDVKQLIEQHSNDMKYTHCVWHGEKL